MNIIRYIFLVSIFIPVVVSGQTKKMVYVSEVLTKSKIEFAVFQDSKGSFSFTDIEGRIMLNSYDGPWHVYHPRYNDTIYYFQPDSNDELKLNLRSENNTTIFKHDTNVLQLVKFNVEMLQSSTPQSLSSYQYSSYNKLLFAGEKLSGNDIHNDSNTSRVDTFLQNHYLFLVESITLNRFQQPGSISEQVLASRISGLKDPVFSLLASGFSTFSFLNTYITIGENRYYSPLSEQGVEHYQYFTSSTEYSLSDIVKVIFFEPKSQTSTSCLQGYFVINNNEPYAVYAFPDQQTSAYDVHVSQTFVKSGTKRFTESRGMYISFKTFDIKGYKLSGVSTSFINDIVLNPKFRKNSFHHNTIIIDSISTSGSNKMFQRYRPDSLGLKELDTYQFSDSISDEFRIERKIKRLSALLAGRFPVAFLDIGLLSLIRFNDSEGWRLGAGGRTNSKVSDNWSLEGYYAYGLKDNTSKYGGAFKYNFPGRWQIKMKVGARKDVKEHAGINLFESAGMLSDNRFRDFLIIKMDEIEESYLSIEAKPHRNFNVKVSFFDQFIRMAHDFKYEATNGPISVISKRNSFNFSRINLNIIFNPGTKRIKKPDQTIDVNTGSPLFWIGLSKGISCDFDFIKVDLKVKKRFNIFRKWEPGFVLYAGIINKPLPAGELYNGHGSYRSFAFEAPYSFATMRMNEFLSDRYLYFFGYLNIGEVFYKARFSKPQILISTHLGFGSLKHDDGYHQSIVFKTMERGYFESGIRLNHILDLKLFSLGVSCYYRYGDYAFQKFKNNLAVKFTVIFPFQNY